LKAELDHFIGEEFCRLAISLAANTAVGNIDAQLPKVLMRGINQI
jgi:hypothetical protein